LEYLVVDIARILDESTAGRRASEELSKRWELAQREFQQLLERAQAGDQDAAERASELEAKVPDEIERRRDDLRRQLIERIKPIIAAIADSTGTTLVLRADQTLAYDPQAEITDQILKELEDS
jgi:Skp family chaperone for outer membrane proteins